MAGGVVLGDRKRGLPGAVGIGAGVVERAEVGGLHRGAVGEDEVHGAIAVDDRRGAELDLTTGDNRGWAPGVRLWTVARGVQATAGCPPLRC